MNLSRNYTCPCLCSLEKERSQFTTSQQHIQAQEPKERSNKWDRAWTRETERLEREERQREREIMWVYENYTVLDLADVKFTLTRLLRPFKYMFLNFK